MASILDRTTNIGGCESGNYVYMGATSAGTVYDDVCWQFTVPENKQYKKLTVTLAWRDQHFAGMHDGYVLALCTKGSTSRGRGSAEKICDNLSAEWVLNYITASFGNTHGGTYTYTFENVLLTAGTTYYLRGGNKQASTYKDIAKALSAIDVSEEATYTVTYEDRIGSTSGALLGSSTETKTYGTAVSGADKGTDPTPSHYYTGYAYASATSATVTQATKVCRIFSPVSYSVTIESRVGSKTGALLGTETTTAPFGTVVSGSAGSSAYTGYSLQSYTSATVKTSGNVVYRIFVGNPYTVTFEGAGSKTVTFGAAYGTLPTPTRAGYEFVGWKLGAQTITPASIVQTASNHTLAAEWEISGAANIGHQGTMHMGLAYVWDAGTLKHAIPYAWDSGEWKVST